MDLKIQEKFVNEALVYLNSQNRQEIIAALCDISDDLAFALVYQYYNLNLDNHSKAFLVGCIAYLLQQNALSAPLSR